MQTQQKNAPANKVDRKLLLGLMLLQMGGIWCFGQIAGIRISKQHDALTTYSLISALVAATGGFATLLAGLLTLLRQRKIASWMLVVAGLLQIVFGILAIANPVWEGKPYISAWLNAGLSLAFAGLFWIASRWLRWQEDTE
jgi:uncharacterized membrane protein HdeD (DUF308 family)